MQEWVAILVYGMRFGRHGEEVCSNNGDSYCHSAASTISGSSTHDFHTRESTSTPGSVGAEG